jgi:glycosyltransferase involved in cell wall biosynthesis
MRRAQKRGVRIVYTVHNALPHGDRRTSVSRAYRRLYKQADALVVLSQFVGQQVLERVDCTLAQKIQIIEHGVLDLECPMPTREQARAELHQKPDADVVLFMGLIRSYKGIADLIDAVAIARRERPNLRLIIAGRPYESFEPYQAQIRRLGLTEIVQSFPRHISEQLKSVLYAAADITVLPHREASQSAMGLEAIGAGKPLIVTRGGALTELIEEGISGYSVPVADPASLAEALCRFFRLSRAEQQSMADASKALGTERFGWSSVAQKHLDLYRRLTSFGSL